MSDKPNVNPFQPSTSPWDQSFTSGGQAGSIVFPSGVAPNASPLVPIIKQQSFNIAGLNSPPAVPSFWENTVIQLAMDGANGGVVWVDQKFGTSPLTHNYVTTSTASFVFGGASTLTEVRTATAGGVRFGTSTLWDFGAKDFTIEGWFSTTETTAFSYMASRRNDSGTFAGWTLSVNVNTNDGLVSFALAEYPGGLPLVGTVKHNDGRWHHVAVVRLGSVWSLYVDGVREATTIFSVTQTVLITDLVFGCANNNSRMLGGYMDEWRIVSGIGVYTGTNFAVPTAPFPTS